MQSYYASLGLDVKFYNPPQGLFSNLNERTHSKILLIDKNVPGNAKFVSGGRNVSDAYFGMDKENWIDRDVELRGTSALQDPKGPIGVASAGFERLWKNPKGKVIGPASSADMKAFQGCVAWSHRAAALDTFLKRNAKKIVAQSQRVTCPNVKYTIDDVMSTSRKPTSEAVLAFLQRPKHDLTMENQYYIPTREERAILAQKRHTVNIDLYTNLFDGSNEMVTLYHGHDTRADDLERQHNFTLSRMPDLIDRWKFTPNGARYLYHAKTFVSDSRDAAVTSFNIDPRSQNINGESGVFVYNCPKFATQVRDSARLSAYLMQKEGFYERCMTGYNPREPGLDPFRALLELFTRNLQ
jgi:phosphatidylserine/phosphatidylglycerophosphate/cardiolipin synthase-like enzyme